MVKQMGGRMNGWMDGQSDPDAWMEGCLSGWIVEMMDGSLGEWVDGWTQTDG